MTGMTPTIDVDDIRTLATIQGAILDRDSMRITRSAPARATGPQVGDYVDLGRGAESPRIRRIAYVWRFTDTGPEEWDYQPTSRLGDGRFHYSEHTTVGNASHSGGLDPARPVAELRRQPDNELRPARGWIWHHGRSAAHNGVDVTLYVPVWEVKP